MNILFMCVANSARSQIAEGLARAMLPQAQVQSAGSHPGKLNPFAVEVLKEVGLDISAHFSKALVDLPEEFLHHLDYVITLCAEEVCPVVPSKAKRLHWPLPDPASREPLPKDEALKRFRETRDALKDRLSHFKSEL